MSLTHRINRFDKVYQKTLTIDQMINYNLHLGNKYSFSNPKMDEYITGISFLGNTLFNLNKTLVLIKRALIFLKNIDLKNKKILFVGTAPNLQYLIKELGTTTKHPYVNKRWIHGLFTNWENISSLIKMYFLFFTKLKGNKRKETRLNENLEGLILLKKLPSVVVIMDLEKDFGVMLEAKRLKIPVVALIDNNNYINEIDYPIPLNKTSFLSILFIINLIISKLKKY